MQDGQIGDPDVGLAFLCHRLPGIQIAIVAREVAARDMDANAMASLEQIARAPKLDTDRVLFVRGQQRRLLGRLTKTRAGLSLRDVDRLAVRVDIGERDEEVGVGYIGREYELCF